MKKTILFIAIVILVAMACDLSVTAMPSTSPAPLSTNTGVPVSVTSVLATLAPTQVPATLDPIATSTSVQTASEGVQVTVDPLSIVLPPQLASGARGNQLPRLEGVPWDLTPGHTQLKLEDYVLQGKAHEPEIRVYPAMPYVEMYPAAFESIHRLDNILYVPGGPLSSDQIGIDQLPAVPFFNAKQAFASHIQVISFQNGQGVRFLTEYAQYPVSANNQDLFYHFEGLTRDGTYYVIAILPITVPVVAETSDAGAVLPAGGVPYPTMGDPNADFSGYYAAATILLNGTSPEAFTPTIDQLDALIQSMRIGP